MTRHIPAERRVTMEAPQKPISNSNDEIHKWVSAGKITLNDSQPTTTIANTPARLACPLGVSLITNRR